MRDGSGQRGRTWQPPFLERGLVAIRERRGLLNSLEKVFLAVFLSHANWVTGEGFANPITLMEETGTRKTTFYKVMKSLKQKRVISTWYRERKGRKILHFRFELARLEALLAQPDHQADRPDGSARPSPREQHRRFSPDQEPAEGRGVAGPAAKDPQTTPFTSTDSGRDLGEDVSEMQPAEENSGVASVAQTPSARPIRVRGTNLPEFASRTPHGRDTDPQGSPREHRTRVMNKISEQSHAAPDQTLSSAITSTGSVLFPGKGKEIEVPYETIVEWERTLEVDGFSVRAALAAHAADRWKRNSPIGTKGAIMSHLMGAQDRYSRESAARADSHSAVGEGARVTFR